MHTSEIHITFLDDNDKNIVWFVLCYKNNEMIKKFAFTNREKAEEIALSWNNSIDNN